MAINISECKLEQVKIACVFSACEYISIFIHSNCKIKVMRFVPYLDVF
jgi:hypothetical protein